MASYREVKNLWTARVRVKNHRPEFKGGFETKTDAKAWAGPVEERLRNAHDVKGLGPSKTTLAVALRDYAYAVTATQGGCVQALCKINKYLRAANFKPLKATKVRGGREFGLDGNGLPSELLQKVGAPLFKLTEQDDKPVFGGAKQKGFEGRRLKNLKREERAQRHREVMAKLPVSQIQAFHLTALVKLMNDDGFEAATQRQEVAILSSFITYAMDVWNGPLEKNPALQFVWPVGAERDRVMTDDEAQRLAVSLPTCGNPDAARLVLFALETAMRRGEALWTACWCDVDYDNRVLKLPHAKTGRREVPLSPEAISMLQEMPQGAPTDTIFNLTDAALDSAWKRACKAAGIVNLRIHDLRHSSATMWSELLHGDIFKLQLITSHRTLKMLQRYVNPKARQLAKQLQTITTPTIAATMRQQMAAAPPDDALASAVGGAPTPEAVQDEPNTSSCDVTLVLKDAVEEAVESPVPGDDRTSANVVSFATYRDKKQLRDAPPRVAAG
jgi:integrase